MELEAFKPLTSVSDQAPFLGGPGNLTFTQCGGFRSLVNYAIKLSAKEPNVPGRMPAPEPVDLFCEFLF